MNDQSPIIDVPSDPLTRKAINEAITEISGFLLQKSGFDELIKDVLDSIHEKYEFPKKTLRALARAHFKADIKAKTQEAEELMDAYDILMGLNDQQ